MKTPSVHSNGSGRAALLDQFTIAERATALAIESVCDAAPNARDYYPQGDGAYPEARREHEARVAKLREVQADLLELARHVRRSP